VRGSLEGEPLLYKDCAFGQPDKTAYAGGAVQSEGEGGGLIKPNGWIQVVVAPVS